MKFTGKDSLKKIARRYPALNVPIIDSENNFLYKQASLKGITENSMDLKDFILSENDYIGTITTDVGNVDILFLFERNDFKLFLMKLAYKCIKTDIPDTIGAMMINGLNNWEKINTHLDEYSQNGGTDRDGEFKRFTACKDNFKDYLLVISNGAYSNVSANVFGFESDYWLRKSQEIRIYHECSHFICRKKYPKTINVIFDEILADCIGIKYAFGSYNKDMAKRFLGFNEENEFVGGRLSFYCDMNSIDDLAPKIINMIDFLENLEIKSGLEISGFEFLDVVMESGYVL